MRKIKIYLKTYTQIFKNSLMSLVEYRTNFFVWFTIHLLEMFLSIIFFKVIFSGVAEFNGWDFYKSLLLVGTVDLILAVGAITYFPFMYDFSGTIQRGELDLLLSKPLDTQFLASIPYCDMEDLIFFPTSVFLISFSLVNIAPEHTSSGIPAFLILIISSNLILYSIITLFQTIAFRAIRINTVANFVWSIVEIGRFPIKVFNGLLRVIFMIIIPAGILITVPAEVLMGIYDWKWIATSIILAIVMFIVSRKVFLNGIKSYSSASS